MPLLVLPVQKQQLACVHHVRVSVEVLVVGERANVPAVGIAAVEVQDHVVLLQGPGTLTAEVGTIGNEDDIVIRQIGRLLVGVQRLVGQLPQSRAVDVDLVQVRHLLDRSHALAEVTAEVVLLRQLLIGIRAAVSAVQRQRRDGRRPSAIPVREHAPGPAGRPAVVWQDPPARNRA